MSNTLGPATGSDLGRPLKGVTSESVIAHRIEDLHDGFDLNAMKGSLRKGRLTASEKAARDALAEIVAQLTLPPNPVNSAASAVLSVVVDRPSIS
jgi:hypothetical protein